MAAPNRRGHLQRERSAPFRDRGSGADEREVDKWLRRLDRALAETDASVPELVAAHVRLDPEMGDREITLRVVGLRGRPDGEAIVARVRANLAAGREPGHGLAVEAAVRPRPRRHHRAHPEAVSPVWRPPVPTTPPPSRPAQRRRECVCGTELAPTEAGCCLGCAVLLVVEGIDRAKIARFYGDPARLDAALDT
jgi:hypothetical protein